MANLGVSNMLRILSGDIFLKPSNLLGPEEAVTPHRMKEIIALA
jgi:hypothetical protein